MPRKDTTNARERKGTVHISDDLIDQIMLRIASGESMNKICTEDSMPTRATLFRWISENEDVRKKYELALSLRADWVFEEIIEIADEAVGTTQNGSMDSGAVAKQKLQVDARKWVLSKMAPKKYGDKIENTVVGADGGAVIVNATINGVPAKRAT